MHSTKIKQVILAGLIALMSILLFTGNIFECRTKTAKSLLQYIVYNQIKRENNAGRRLHANGSTNIYQLFNYSLIASDLYTCWPTALGLLSSNLLSDEKKLLKICYLLDANTKKTLDSMLKVAVFKNNIKKTKQLLSLGSNPNVIVDKGNPALNASVLKNHIEIARLLIDAGANLNITSAKGWNALNVAIFYHYNTLAKLLIKSGADISTNIKNIKKSPLWMSVSKGNLEILELLLSLGVNTNVTIPSNFSGDRPTSVVDYALNKRQYEIAKRLIHESGPSKLTDENVIAQPSISNACLAGVQRELTRRSYQGFTLTNSNPIIESITKGNSENEILAIIDAHPDLIDTEDEKGETPLMAAIEHEKPAVVKHLVEKGCDVNKPDGNGFTPGLLAAEQSNTEIFRSLINEHFDPQLSGCHDDSLFHFLISRNLMEPMKVLISEKVDLDLSDSTGTPLQIALSHNNHDGDEFAKVLLEGGADPLIQLGSFFKTPITSIRESAGREELKKLINQKYPENTQDGPWVIEKNSSDGKDQLHVVSVYEGSNSQRNKASRIPITVSVQSKSINLLLMSHEPVTWQIQVKSDVTIKKVFLKGPILSSISGLPDSTEQIRLVKNTSRALRYESLKNKDALLDMFEIVKDVIGNKPTTIQSKYKGRAFMIDGETTINFINPIINTPPKKKVKLISDGLISEKGTVLNYGKAGAFSSAVANINYNAGKWYFEAVLNTGDKQNKPGTYTNVGIINSSSETKLFSTI